MCKLDRQNVRIVLQYLIYLLYFVFVCFSFWLIYDTVKDGFDRQDQLIFVGGLVALVTIPLSLFQIVMHLKHFNQPDLQKPIIRILWMVPIYAVNAWLGLKFPEQITYMDSIRECYEAYVIYNFMKYLLNHLNMEMDLQANMYLKPQINHFFPCCCLRPWNMTTEFLQNCKHGILQYTVVRPVVAVISVICRLAGVYGNKTLSFSVAYPYMIMVNNISQPIAMYCLMLFYKATKEELRPIRPLPKFICIKSVIFFSFFQGMALDILVYFGIIKDIFGATTNNDNLSEVLQNFLLCLEMLLAALAHHFYFSYHEYQINIPNYGNNRTWRQILRSMFDMSDVHQDVADHLGAVGSSISRSFHGRSGYSRPMGQEHEYLINCAPDTMTSYQGSASKTANQSSVKKKATNYGTVDQGKPTIPIAPTQPQSSFYSPQHQGAPRPDTMMNFEVATQQKSLMDTDTESPSNSNTFRKSDSTNTNSWLSTSASEDIANIEFRSLEQDQIRLPTAKAPPKI